MPTCDYHCEQYKKAFSLVMSMRDRAQRKARCPKCKSRKVTEHG